MAVSALNSRLATWSNQSQVVSATANRLYTITSGTNKTTLKVAGCVAGGLGLLSSLSSFVNCYTQAMTVNPVMASVCINTSILTTGAAWGITGGISMLLFSYTVSKCYQAIFGTNERESNERESNAAKLISVISDCLEGLSSKGIPPQENAQAPSTLNNLIEKLHPNSRAVPTRNDYEQLVEQILANSRLLFNWHSVTGKNREPFDALLNALKGASNDVILKALDETQAKLIELQKKRAPSEAPLIHPRLEQLTKALIAAKTHLVLGQTPQNAPDLERLLKRCVNTPAILSSLPERDKIILTSLQTEVNRRKPDSVFHELPWKQEIADAELNLLDPALDLLDPALNLLLKTLPKEHPFRAEITDLLGDRAHVFQRTELVQQCTQNPLKRALTSLCHLVIDQHPLNRLCLFQKVKTLDVIHPDLQLERHLRDFLKTHYQPTLDANHPVGGAILDNDHQLDAFLAAQANLDRTVILNALHHAFFIISAPMQQLPALPAREQTLHDLIDIISNPV